MIGDLKKFEIDNCLGRDGQSLKLTMQQYGLDPNEFINAARPKEEIKAYIELHIEHGPVLEKCSIDIGVVEEIVGLLTSEFNFYGQANHAGPTPVSLRQDALRAEPPIMFSEGHTILLEVPTTLSEVPTML